MSSERRPPWSCCSSCSVRCWPLACPILIALAGIGVAIPLIGIAVGGPTPNFTDQVAALIGIGVGIDYTLLVVTRYRAALGPTVRRSRRSRRLCPPPGGP